MARARARKKYHGYMRTVCDHHRIIQRDVVNACRVPARLSTLARSGDMWLWVRGGGYDALGGGGSDLGARGGRVGRPGAAGEPPRRAGENGSIGLA